ncbi:hypothetical protein DAEQUDRAFT_679698, partial [Daedalea quercina L-15889]
ESKFCGPYNKLLNTLFPSDTDFTVDPQYMPNNTCESADFLVMFEVLLEDRPAFILGLKLPKALHYASSHELAD